MGRSSLLALFATAAMAATFADARADARVPVSALTDPFGATAGLFGGGTAVIGDISAVDYNPAGLALTKEVAITGEAKWRDASTLAVEAGVADSLMSEIAAGLKGRLSTKASGAKDRRFSVGLAERMNESAFVLGLGGDYIQIERTAEERANGDKKYRETPRLRGGAIYNITETFLVGIRSDGWLDRFDKTKSHAIGLGIGFAGHYVANTDVVFADAKPDKALFGLTVLAKDYLDLRMSYGYGLETKHNGGAAGVTLKSQQFRLHYTITKPIFTEKPFFHQIGAGLVVAM